MQRSASLTVSQIDTGGTGGDTAPVTAIYDAFGRNLRKARTDAGLTQRELAQRVGLARTSITNIESGTQHVSLHHLFLLASAVGTQPEQLLPGEPLDELAALVPAKALKDLEADAEQRDFAVRILSKTAAVTQAATAAASEE